MIYRPRIVPIAEVNHDTHRWPHCLAEVARAVAGAINRERAARSVKWPDIHFLSRSFIDDRGKGMLQKAVMQLAPFPLFWVGPLKFFHVLVGVVKTAQQQLIPFFVGVVGETTCWMFEDIQHGHHAWSLKGPCNRLREKGILERLSQMAAKPYFVQSGCR